MSEPSDFELQLKKLRPIGLNTTWEPLAYEAGYRAAKASFRNVSKRWVATSIFLVAISFAAGYRTTSWRTDSNLPLIAKQNQADKNDKTLSEKQSDILDDSRDREQYINEIRFSNRSLTIGLRDAGWKEHLFVGSEEPDTEVDTPNTFPSQPSWRMMDRKTILAELR